MGRRQQAGGARLARQRLRKRLRLPVGRKVRHGAAARAGGGEMLLRRRGDERRIADKHAASRGASRATRDARREPPETARRRATGPRVHREGHAGHSRAVPRRPRRSRSRAGRLGDVTKTLEMGFRWPRKGGGGNRGCASETRRRAGSEPRDAPRLFPSVTLRPATAAFAESERDEVMDAMLPRASVAKNGARRASTCLFIRRGAMCLPVHTFMACQFATTAILITLLSDYHDILYQSKTSRPKHRA